MGEVQFQITNTIEEIYGCENKEKFSTPNWWYYYVC